MSEDFKKTKIFQGRKVRTHWDDEKEKWFFSVVDVVAILTDNDFQTARNYWKVLKHRLSDEGNETVTNCNQLKMLAEDGKFRETHSIIEIFIKPPYLKVLVCSPVISNGRRMSLFSSIVNVIRGEK